VSRGDRWLLVLPLVLTAIGLVMVYSSSAILGITRYHDPNHFLIRQSFRVLIGLVALVVCLKLPMRWVERAAPALLATAVTLLGLVILFGRSRNGAARWIWGLQPIELARLMMIVFLAWWLKRRPPAEWGFRKGLLPPLGIVVLLAGMVYMQPNMSSAIMLFATGFLLLFLSGAPMRHLAVPVACAVAAAVVGVMAKPYMLKRVETYVALLTGAEVDARGAGYQLEQSLIAIGSGGWIGRGIGGGLQKYLFLPEAHTDFIFSILGEETGFVGASVLFALYALLVWRGLRTAARATDRFAFLLAAGLTVQIGLYALVNLSVATGLAPTTGLPLPFVSYGGSALMANLAAAGLLYRISALNGDDEAITRQRWTRGTA
jgi:cell division protein FtsW